MAISGFLFLSNRIFQLITLIPIVGMLSWFVHAFTKANELTPNYILVLFIVAVLAAAWVFFTLLLYRNVRYSGPFLAFVDLCFVGALIAGVYYLRGITNTNCASFSGQGTYVSLGQVGVYGPQLHVQKSCAMLKASFALAIIDILLFFCTFLLALLVWHHHGSEKVSTKTTTYTRHGSRRGSRSSYDRSPRRSHHSSSRRQYYV